MPSTWPGIEPATLGIEGQRYTNSPIRSTVESERNEGDNAGEMSPGSSTDSYPAVACIGLKENRGKNLNQVLIFFHRYQESIENPISTPIIVSIANKMF
ncbi:hypothetical protein ANN_02503 [Periplaneta americana]|uniref:Uncharacterized protein n=1 Tax=Periplaneta americana TaxID=6978 RepID=A0ABQ8TYZ8_PERAM|nr:hypothetical protein ANN_02503 [Periplaneta americana]